MEVTTTDLLFLFAWLFSMILFAVNMKVGFIPLIVTTILIMITLEK